MRIMNEEAVFTFFSVLLLSIMPEQSFKCLVLLDLPRSTSTQEIAGEQTTATSQKQAALN